MSGFREILKNIKKIEYDTPKTVGLCLLSTIEHMLPDYKERLNTLIGDKMTEPGNAQYNWLYTYSKYRSTRYGWKFNKTRIVNYEFMSDWANEYRNRGKNNHQQ